MKLGKRNDILAKIVIAMIFVVASLNIIIIPLIYESKLIDIEAKDRLGLVPRKDIADPEAVNCSEILQSFRNDMIDKARTKDDMNYQRAFVTLTKTAKPFYVSTHDEIIDKNRAETFKSQNYYEKQLTLRVAEIFDEKKSNGAESIMLDVGANIGWFSLVAAAHGATKVYSFEPNVQNTIRFCESLQLNGWLHDGESRRNIVIPILKGASDENGKLEFYTPDINNPGTFSFAKNTVGKDIDKKKMGDLEVTTLDSFAERHGWFESKPTIALFKIDVETYEKKVFKGAERLIKSNLIEKIAMEIRTDNIGRDRIAGVNAITKLLVDAGYELYLHGGWMGPNKPVTKVYTRWEDLAADFIKNNVYNDNVMFRLQKRFV